MLALTIATILLVLLFAGVLLFGVARIMYALDRIGGAPTSTPVSHLAKARWGVRAIERQTAALEPELRRLDATLGALGAELGGLRRDVAALAAAWR